jgi:Bax protein
MRPSDREESVKNALPDRNNTTCKALFAVAAIALVGILLCAVVYFSRGIFSPFQKESFRSGMESGRKVPSPIRTRSFYHFVEVRTASELIHRLKQYDIWSVKPHSSIPPVIFNRIPEELSTYQTDLRKKIFLHTLLPAAMIVHSEVEHEKKYLAQILAKYDAPLQSITFDPEIDGWQGVLEQDEFLFIELTTKKYRTTKASLLLNRVDTIPVSLMLAQGALESSWGTSRFVKEANNLFGICTWKEEGVIPEMREDGKYHKVASYPSLIDSVRAYCLTLNRIGAYVEFRNARKKTKDPFLLVEKLYKYSERGSVYIDELKQVLKVNNLQMYDTCSLKR